MKQNHMVSMMRCLFLNQCLLVETDLLPLEDPEKFHQELRLHWVE